MPVARTAARKRFRPETPKADFLDRDDILGQLIVFTLKSHEADYVTKRGDVSPKSVVSIKVLTGPQKGRSESEFFMFGNMAENAALVPVGETAAARVASGKSKRGGVWYGLDFDLDEADEALADEA